MAATTRDRDRVISYMAVALYEDARQGKVEAFGGYGERELKLLKTPKLNTLLHVYLATDKDHVDKRRPLHPALQAMIRMAKTFISIIPQPTPYTGAASELVVIVISQLISKAITAWFPARSASTGKSTIFVEQMLIRCPSLLLEANEGGEIPLHIAARYGHSAVVTFLIQRAMGLPLDHHGNSAGEPEQQGIEAARLMLRTRDKEFNTALHTAITHGQLLVVQALLESEDPGFSYSANKNQETPLYIAARKGSSRLVSAILDKFGSAAAHDHGGPHGRSALHAAAMAGNEVATRKILQHVVVGQLRQPKDGNGQTPLHYAAHLGHYSVVKALLEDDPSAAYTAIEETGMTALLLAARQGHEDIVREIISTCPDCCELVDKNGWNVLHFLSVRCSTYAVDLFLHGQTGTAHPSIANLGDEKDINGNTPLEVYIACGGLYGILTPFEAYFDLEKLGQRAFNKSPITDTKKEQITNMLRDVVSGGVAEAPVRPIKKFEKKHDEEMEKTREAHLVVAALIATVTFAAAITLPGGFISEQTSKAKGTAVLIHNAAFKAFVISDAVALVCSLLAVTMHFVMALPYFQSGRSYSTLHFATLCTVFAVIAMVVAFSTGTYAVLQPSSGLAIATCCIGLSFFVILLLYFIGYYLMLVSGVSYLLD